MVLLPFIQEHLENGASFRECAARIFDKHELIVDQSTLWRFWRRQLRHEGRRARVRGDDFAEEVCEVRAVGGLAEDRLPAAASAHDVVKTPRRLEASGSSHADDAD